MFPLRTQAILEGRIDNSIFKVLTLEETLECVFPLDRVIVDLLHTNVPTKLDSLSSIGIGGVLTDFSPTEPPLLPILHSLPDSSVIKPGDVVRIQADGFINILYRRDANSNSLFVTERYNNYCLMCSQPPVQKNDDWRIAEILDLIPLIDKKETSLCFTGGEPTLLEDNLIRIIEKAADHLPNTQFFTLTNGRRFADRDFVRKLTSAKERMLWAIPLYSDSAPRHDYVVQAQGAFYETLNGIYNLAEYGHRIEIRYVIHAQIVERIEKFAEFIYRNLPFVEHVAFMGLEPMGFARVNRQQLWIDPFEYTETLTRACWYLNDRGITASIYNIPLCLLPQAAWPLAQKSISDWKNKFVEECELCTVRENCCGFFASVNSDWKSQHIQAVREEGGVYEKELEEVS